MIRFQNLVSDECHRLHTELRMTTQKNLIPKLESELLNLHFEIWEQPENLTVTKIMTPFNRIIVHPHSTDIITCVAINSLHSFLISGLFSTSNDISELISCFCNCQYQSTSEVETLSLSLQILNSFSYILQKPEFLTPNAVDSLLEYCIQDLKQIDQSGPHVNAIKSVLKQLSTVIITTPALNEIFPDLINALFWIIDISYVDNGWIPRGAALDVFLTISRFPSLPYDQEILIDSCVFLEQMLTVPDTQNNFVVTLRIFFHTFSERWIKAPALFSRSLNSLLNLINNRQVSSAIRATAFEIFIDFIQTPYFYLDFFSVFADSPFFKDVFQKFTSTILGFANVPVEMIETHESAVHILASIISNISPDNLSDPSKFTFSVSNSNISTRVATQFYNYNCTSDYEVLTTFAKQFNESFVPFLHKEYNFLFETNNPKQQDNQNMNQTTQEVTENSQLQKNKKIEAEKEAEKIAFMLMTAPGISKTQIGEYFGKNSPFVHIVLEKYISMFDFSDLDIDQAIRVFMTSFKVVGESQIIDRIFENFSKAFFNSRKPNQYPYFANFESVHVFSFSWMMLHTSLHNPNVSQTSRTTLPAFLKMLEGQNGGKDFDALFLTSIYASIKRSEITLEVTNTPAFWLLLWQKWKCFDRYCNSTSSILQKSDTSQSQSSQNLQNSQNLNQISFVKKSEGEIVFPKHLIIRIFKEIWQQTAPIFTALFESGMDFVLPTFRICAKIAFYYTLHDVLDNLVASLCRFTHFSDSGSKRSLLSIIQEEKAKKALIVLSEVIQEHGSQIQEGWKWIIELLLDLFRVSLLPDEMCSQISVSFQYNNTNNNNTNNNNNINNNNTNNNNNNINNNNKSNVDDNKKSGKNLVRSQIVITPNSGNNRIRRPSSSSSVRSIFKFIGAADVESEGEEGSELQLNESKLLVKDCKFHLILEHSAFFSPQSLSYFLKSLILSARNCCGFLHSSYSQDQLQNQSQSQFQYQYQAHNGPRLYEVAICCHLLTQAIIINADRIQGSQLWNAICELFSDIFHEGKTNFQNSKEKEILFFRQRVLLSFFDLLCHMWSQKPLRSELLTLLDRVSELSSASLQSLNPEISFGLSEFFSLHLQSFSETFYYKPILKLLISVGDYNAASLLHSLFDHFISQLKNSSKTKQNSDNDNCNSNNNIDNSINNDNDNNINNGTLIKAPQAFQYDEFWGPMIGAALHFCVSIDSNDRSEIFQRFRDLQTALEFGGAETVNVLDRTNCFKGDKITGAVWDNVIKQLLIGLAQSKALYVFFSQQNQLKEGEKTDQKLANISFRLLLLTKIVFKAFLIGSPAMCEMPSFETRWFSLIEQSHQLTKMNDNDLKESIPELISNALIVMKTNGIFGTEKRKKIWTSSLYILQSLDPNLAQMISA